MTTRSWRWALCAALWVIPSEVFAQEAPALGNAVSTGDDLARAERLGLGTHRAAHTLLFGTPPPRWVRASGTAAPRDLLWPVRNGSRSQGYRADHGRHRAIDVGGRCGAPVRAAHAGLVAYSSDGVGTMGNVVVLVGPDGWVTAYGHCRRTLAAVGSLVARGDTIAEVGDTGDAVGCHVHFVAYHRGRRLDPERWLSGAPRPRRARRAGRSRR